MRLGVYRMKPREAISFLKCIFSSCGVVSSSLLNNYTIWKFHADVLQVEWEDRDYVDDQVRNEAVCLVPISSIGHPLKYLHNFLHKSYPVQLLCCLNMYSNNITEDEQA